jgi:lactate dehydrogenase-like 2-hydroxyacid dehydrogenase
MARVLLSAPALEECLQALGGNHLQQGAPGSDAQAVALICPPTVAVDAGALAAMPLLRVIGVAGAGTDAIDLQAAAARGVEVLTAGEALIDTTADLAFGLIIAASRLMGEAQESLRAGDWNGWRFDQAFGRDVTGATLGLLGFGAIGRAVAVRAAAFSMTVLHHTRTPTGQGGWCEHLEEMLAEIDILSIHVPLTDATRLLIDERRLGLMRPGAVLVNTARGAVVDERALARSLREGHLLAAGLDVYSDEPRVDPELLAAPRTVLLPHIGSATERTRRAMLRLAAEKVAAYLAAQQLS